MFTFLKHPAFMAEILGRELVQSLIIRYQELGFCCLNSIKFGFVF
jgi:hypothetical protein